MSRPSKPLLHQFAAGIATGLLHLAFFLAFLVGTSSAGPRAPLPEPIPVELIQVEPEPRTDKDIAADYGQVDRSRDPVQEPRKVDKPRPVKPDSPVTDQPQPPETPAVAESRVDCRYMDEAACSPCLADPKVCIACCRKSEKPGAGGTDPKAPSSPAGTCLEPPCAPEDPCSPDILSEMASSFCPRVRSAIYSRLGTVRLSSIPPDTELSARISVTVSATGTLSLSALLSSSGNAQFDSAIRSSVGEAAAVLPPARLAACVSTRGCAFPVTIGARSGSPSGTPAPDMTAGDPPSE